MNIIGITIITDPDYRQDPAREAIQQALMVFDSVVVCYGRAEDKEMLEHIGSSGKLYTTYMHWPQPEWSFEQLPMHLNAAIEKARSLDADWIVRFDADCFIHENERQALRDRLTSFKKSGVAIGTLCKYQFFKADRAYEKGNVALCLNTDFNIKYGRASGQYTDLCQPLLNPVETMDTMHVAGLPGERKLAAPIPYGPLVPVRMRAATGVHVWNFDYTFKTLDRARELLYHFDCSHAKFWGAGYSGKQLDEITPESALADYLAMSGGRVKKCVHRFSNSQYPYQIRKRISELTPEQFGHSMWGRVAIPA